MVGGVGSAVVLGLGWFGGWGGWGGSGAGGRVEWLG